MIEIENLIKSACEFYLKFKDNPELLIEEHPEYEAVIKDKFELKIPHYGWLFVEYNEWLFKLAFRSVLK